MSLDEDASVDCDGICSSLDTIGCKLVSHKEVEKECDKAIKKLPSERYVGIMNNLQTNHPVLYKMARYLGF